MMKYHCRRKLKDDWISETIFTYYDHASWVCLQVVKDVGRRDSPGHERIHVVLHWRNDKPQMLTAQQHIMRHHPSGLRQLGDLSQRSIQFHAIDHDGPVQPIIRAEGISNTIGGIEFRMRSEADIRRKRSIEIPSPLIGQSLRIDGCRMEGLGKT